MKISTEKNKKEDDNTRNYLEKSLTHPKDKTKNNPYQKEFLLYVEGFNKGIINSDPTDVFSMTKG